MKLNRLLLNVVLAVFLCVSCSTNSQEDNVNDTETKKPLKIISLGDSYTIGASVCDTCRFPEQLKDSLKLITKNDNIALKVIATTGWTTSALLNALKDNTIENDYDLATLLIGVNNQFQGRPFEQFETQFPELVNKAICYTKGIKKHLIVVSIPDYAYTPYGAGRESISTGIDKYNNFIEAYCKQNDITYVYITDITRLGLDEPNLIASDRLHPSTLAYSKFVSRILPYALEKIGYNSN
ncbi:SGNH/GDSL hydrolase family protein [Hyunsoonleella pacifica]|uniref:SGNH/GDSL hydrolase family protein n=1 Tax=Hyunsoonleella pacifica TaxID=1080224 RepID=A0A4V2JAY1_9FLAO|nr:SGNH/GDSL hydrolase family protein [Hyunsoonleella pacifica]TBN15675.1 SGNH/GDSL hydrolase family protein [Hyunsoonleella pacifica]GGD21730.1 lysophospholipase [Hyunsoonleella pacifica]